MSNSFNSYFNSSTYVFLKDIRSEYRRRVAFSSVFLFILTTVAAVLFSEPSEKPSYELSAGILWIIMFFGAMTGLQKAFVSEEERGTSLFLRISAPAASIYFGKLLFNIIFCLILDLFSSLLFFVFIPWATPKSPEIFLVGIILVSIGLAAAATVISAIIARATSRNALFPVLSFPVVLPLMLLAIDTMKLSFEGINFSENMDNFNMMIAYAGVLISASFILFEFIWLED